MGRPHVGRRLRGARRAQSLAAGLALLVAAPLGAPARGGPAAPRPQTLYLEYRESWVADVIRVADPNAARVRRRGRVWMSATGAYRESLERPVLLRWFVGNDRWEWIPEQRVAAHWTSAEPPGRGWWLFGPRALRASGTPSGKPAGAVQYLGRPCTLYEELSTDSFQRREVQVAVREWWDDALGVPLRRSISLDNWESFVIEATRFEPDWPVSESFFTDRRLPADTRRFEAPLDLESLEVRLRRKPDLSVEFFDLRFWAVRGSPEMALPVPYNVPKGYELEGMLPERVLLPRRGDAPPVPTPLRFAFLNLETQDILWWSLAPARGALPAGEARAMEWGPARVIRLPGGRTRVVADLGGTRVTAEAGRISADELLGVIEHAGAWWTRDIAVEYVGWTRRWQWLPEAEAQQAAEGRAGFLAILAGEYEVILGVQADGPAERAGIRPWDLLIAVDGVPVPEIGQGLPRDERHLAVAQRIRGKVGSPVRLRVRRAGQRDPIECVVTRSVERVERF